MAFESNKEITVDDHIPKNSKLLLNKLLNLDFTKISLVGFSDDLKWLKTLLDKKEFVTTIYDWRKEFFDYDCGDQKIQNILNLKKNETDVIVLCWNELSMLKESIIFLKNKGFFDIPIIYEISTENDPGSQLEPYKTIIKKGKKNSSKYGRK